MDVKVKVRKTDKKRWPLVTRILKLGSNIHMRTQRPAWTSTIVTGGMTAFKHLHGQDFRANYFK